MAMLVELHLQGQDKFVYTCNNCKNSVETRYHCQVCEVSACWKEIQSGPQTWDIFCIYLSMRWTRYIGFTFLGPIKISLERLELFFCYVLLITLENLFQDYDLCVPCYRKVGHEHKMDHLGLGLDDGTPGSGSNQNALRRNSVQRCITSLVHACQCRNANCQIQQCIRMKKVSVVFLLKSFWNPESVYSGCISQVYECVFW